MSSFEEIFPNEATCLDALAYYKWGGKFRCPGCGHTEGTQLKSRAVFQCRKCKKQTSIKAGTIFHKSSISLHKLMRILWDLCQGNNSSSRQIAIELDMHQSTAWEWSHKFRTVLEQVIKQFANIVQVYCSMLEKATFRRSDESPSKHAEQEEPKEQECGETNFLPSDSIGQSAYEEHLAQAAFPFSAFEKRVSASDLAEQISFLLGIFKGVSRKFLQKYLAQFSFSVCHYQSDKFSLVMRKCSRNGPISSQKISDYSSPEKVLTLLGTLAKKTCA